MGHPGLHPSKWDLAGCRGGHQGTEQWQQQGHRADEENPFHAPSDSQSGGSRGQAPVQDGEGEERAKGKPGQRPDQGLKSNGNVKKSGVRPQAVPDNNDDDEEEVCIYSYSPFRPWKQY